MEQPPPPGLEDIPLPEWSSKSKAKVEEHVLSPSKIPLPGESSLVADKADPNVSVEQPPDSIKSAVKSTDKVGDDQEKPSGAVKIKPIKLVRNRFESYKRQVEEQKKSAANKQNDDAAGPPDKPEVEDESKVVDDLFREFLNQKLSDVERTHRENIIARLQKKQAEFVSKEKQIEEEMNKRQQNIIVQEYAEKQLDKEGRKFVTNSPKKPDRNVVVLESDTNNINSKSDDYKKHKHKEEKVRKRMVDYDTGDSEEEEIREVNIVKKDEGNKHFDENRTVLKSGKQKLDLKISVASSSLITVGAKIEEDKIKSREDGELTPDAADSESSNTDNFPDDDSETGSIKEETKKPKKKKKKKDKKKKKKKKKEGKKKKSHSPKHKRSLSRSRSRSRSRSASPHSKKHKRESPGDGFDKSKGVWKDRSRSTSRDREKYDKKSKYVERSKERDKSKDKYDDHYRESERYRDRHKDKYDKYGSRDRTKENYRETDRKRSRERDRSERQERSRSRSRSRSKPKSEINSVPTWSDRARERELYKRDKERGDSRGYRDKYRRSRSKSRSKSPSKDLRVKIDKAKLRQIAIRNAVANMKSGGPAVNLKPAELAAMKSGGKSVDELTEYCKKIAEKGEGGMSSSSEEGEAKSGDEVEEQPFLHHPFKVNPVQAQIVMNIRNSKPLPLLTSAEKAEKAGTLRLQFPVSSGSTHRSKEGEWVVVEKTLSTVPGTIPELPSETSHVVSTPAAVSAKVGESLQLHKAEPNDKVFEEFPKKDVDIGSLVSQRLGAIRKLSQNPHDVQAIGKLYEVNKEMNTWAKSKELPGQYYGTTGANVMSSKELNSGFQAWAKKDQFHKAPIFKSGIGMALLQKMGWKQGTGLGKDNKGDLEPLALDVKMDRRGLSSQGETARPVPQVRMAKDMSHKHPVSALTELCIRKRWGHPNWIMVHESGPDHKKNFLYKVSVNNVDYQPSVASGNKKLAKAQAATVALQELGLLPRDAE